MPGASGVKALTIALEEPADGYTTIDGYVAPLIISPLFEKAPWGCDDFVPLHSATPNAFAIISRADEDRWTDFPSLIEYIKAHPGETRYSGGADLALPHMVAAKVLQTFGAAAAARAGPVPTVVRRGVHPPPGAQNHGRLGDPGPRYASRARPAAGSQGAAAQTSSGSPGAARARAAAA